MSTDKEQIRQQTSSLQNKVSYKAVRDQATKAAPIRQQAKSTSVGTSVGSVRGGVQSISNKTTSAGQTSTSAATEGLVQQGSAIQNVDDGTMGASTNALESEFGVKLTLEWSAGDSDGNVYPVGSSLTAETDDTLSEIITKNSGLGQAKTDEGESLQGFPHDVLTNASPAGVTDTLQTLLGRVGAFPSVSAVNQLAAQANAAQQAIKAQIDSDWNALVAATGGVPSNLVGLSGDPSQAYDSAVQATANGVTDVSNLIQRGVAIDQTGLEKDLGEIADSSDGSAVFNSTVTFGNEVRQVGVEGTNFRENARTIISPSSLGLVQGFVGQLGNARGDLQTTYPQLSDAQADKVIDLAQGTEQEFDQAVTLVATLTSEDPANVRTRLLQVNTTIAGATVVGNETSAFQNPYKIGDTNWKKGVTGQEFTYVSSVEELEAEMARPGRDITEVIVHWSETFTNKNIGSEELNDIGVGLGLDGIGYHFVIKRDGSLQRGRPLGSQGQHASANGHDKYSIGLCFIGGYNCSSGTPNPEEYLSSQSLTRAQMNTFEQFCRAFYNQNPGGQILGHNNIDPNEVDPGFDVIDYCRDVFGKASVFSDPFNQGPYSPTRLVFARPVA